MCGARKLVPQIQLEPPFGWRALDPEPAGLGLGHMLSLTLSSGKAGAISIPAEATEASGELAWGNGASLRQDQSQIHEMF